MDTTIFQKFYEEKTALINPTDCIKPIDNFPEVCDGGPHKRWSMWFNSKQREEPYQVLTSL